MKKTPMWVKMLVAVALVVFAVGMIFIMPAFEEDQEDAAVEVEQTVLTLTLQDDGTVDASGSNGFHGDSTLPMGFGLVNNVTFIGDFDFAKINCQKLNDMTYIDGNTDELIVKHIGLECSGILDLHE